MKYTLTEEQLNWPRILSDLQELEGLSQIKLADKLGVTQQYVSCLMKGKRPPSKRMLPLLLEWVKSSIIDLSDYHLTPQDYPEEIKALCRGIKSLKNRTEILAYLNKMMDTF